MTDLFTTIFIYCFVFGFFILLAFALIGYVDKKPPKNKTLINLIKTYWSEAFLIICMIVASWFFVKGIGV